VDVWCLVSPPERPPRVVERLEVEVHGRVESIEDSAFEEAVRSTWATCRRSLGLRDDIDVTLDAALV
jgi:organic hydroperoxide reductase OsmC/OhrA